QAARPGYACDGMYAACKAALPVQLLVHSPALQAGGIFVCRFPRALPWAKVSRAVGAGSWAPRALFLLLLLGLFASRSTWAAGSTNPGENLARIYCGSCHLFPEPNLVDKKTWNEQTLPRMRIRMGMEPEIVNQHPEASFIKAAEVIPTQPLVNESDWKLIVAYYLAAAPESPLPQAPHVPIENKLTLFAAENPKFKLPVPSTTMVKISERDHRVYIGDAETKSLGVFTFDGKPPASVLLSNVPVSLTETPRGLFVTMIGKFMPSDNPIGALAILDASNPGSQPPLVLLKSLPRPTHAEFADLNRDGKLDF